jgi:hypothetical protein
MSTSISLFGYAFDLVAIVIVLAIVGLMFLFYRIQKSDKLDFADLITKDGRTVSLTKVLQLVGGVTATWVIIKMTLIGTLGMDMFAVYLTYVASIEGFSKFMAAKYQYTERSVRDTYREPEPYREPESFTPSDQEYRGPHK